MSVFLFLQHRISTIRSLWQQQRWGEKKKRPEKTDDYLLARFIDTSVKCTAKPVGTIDVSEVR